MMPDLPPPAHACQDTLSFGRRGPRRVVVDGIPFDLLTEAEVVEHVMSSLRRSQGGLIVTPNADIMRRLRSAEDRRIVQDAALVLADGMPIVWASRLAGVPLPERVTGASLLWSLSRGAASSGRSVFLLGAAPGVANRAARALQTEFPGLRVAGHHSPPPAFEETPHEIRKVQDLLTQTQPDIVFVALGFPRQERLGRHLHNRNPARWFLGCGGALDMASGDLPRAHPLAQRLGAEWIHRLALQPRRLARRYLVHDAPYVVSLLCRSVMARAGRSR